MNNKHLSWYKEINNNFIIASRAYFLQVDYQPSAHNHVIFLPDIDMSYEAIYSDPAKKPIHLQNVEYQSFTQPIEGIHVPNTATLDYPLAGNLHRPHRANTEATAKWAFRPLD